MVSEVLSLKEHDRMFAKVRLEPSGCWRWTAGLNPNGYGQTSIRRGGKTMTKTVHRLFYRVFRGEPGDLDLHHVCENRWCVNPAHLTPLTRKEHAAVTTGWKPWQAEKEFCKHGHEFDDGNTRFTRRKLPNGEWSMRRFCRACQRDCAAKYRAEKKAA